jgi:GT2 family glycosyltransferase
LFNHGAHKGVWYGEDYAFCRNWRDAGGELIIVPDLDITHHTTEKAYEGNFHIYLRQQPGGDLYVE